MFDSTLRVGRALHILMGTGVHISAASRSAGSMGCDRMEQHRASYRYCADTKRDTSLQHKGYMALSTSARIQNDRSQLHTEPDMVDTAVHRDKGFRIYAHK